MRTKVTLILIFLNVALFFFIFKFERNWRTETASRESRRRVLGPEAADIRSLEITSTAPGGSFSLVRKRDTWFLTKPLDLERFMQLLATIREEISRREHLLKAESRAAPRYTRRGPGALSLWIVTTCTAAMLRLRRASGPRTIETGTTETESLA